MATLQELLVSPETAGVWSLIPDRSTVVVTGKSMWLPVKVKFGEFSGDGQVTGSGGVFGRVDVRATSLHSGIKRRDEHLRSADFFEVEKFPDISVVVTAAEASGGDNARLRANLTVKGTTLPIELPAIVRVLDDGSIRVAAQTIIDRSTFGVTGNLLGMVGKTAKISADLVFAHAAV